MTRTIGGHAGMQGDPRQCPRHPARAGGSCSADGKLSFSWRLILAPQDVLIYVAAHEVAHLRYLDHSRARSGARSRTPWRLMQEAIR